MRYTTTLCGLAVAGALAIAGCGGAAAVTHSARRAAAATPAATSTVKAAPTVTVTRTLAPRHSAAAATPAPAPAAPGLTSAEAVVDQYYQDITNGDFGAAWALGGSNIADASYSTWVAGYATTASISLQTESSFGASQVQAVLDATQSDGTVNMYHGTYTVQSGVIVAAAIEQS